MKWYKTFFFNTVLATAFSLQNWQKNFSKFTELCDIISELFM